MVQWTNLTGYFPLVLADEAQFPWSIDISLLGFYYRILEFVIFTIDFSHLQLNLSLLQ